MKKEESLRLATQAKRFGGDLWVIFAGMVMVVLAVLPKWKEPSTKYTLYVISAVAFLVAFLRRIFNLMSTLREQRRRNAELAARNKEIEEKLELVTLEAFAFLNSVLVSSNRDSVQLVVNRLTRELDDAATAIELPEATRRSIKIAQIRLVDGDLLLIIPIGRVGLMIPDIKMTLYLASEAMGSAETVEKQLGLGWVSHVQEKISQIRLERSDDQEFWESIKARIHSHGEPLSN